MTISPEISLLYTYIKEKTRDIICIHVCMIRDYIHRGTGVTTTIRRKRRITEKYAEKDGDARAISVNEPVKGNF